MEKTNAFVGLCERVIADCEAGMVDLHIAAGKIYSQANKHPLEEAAHPMLNKASDLAFDISEEYRSERDDTADWAILVRTINNYTAGNWEPTCWILSAMYGEYSGATLHQSCSVFVRRQNGTTIIETASRKLKNAIARAAEKLNAEQTDERYLQNFLRHIPASVDEYRLVSKGVAEYLTEPYYSTA